MGSFPSDGTQSDSFFVVFFCGGWVGFSAAQVCQQSQPGLWCQAGSLVGGGTFFVALVVEAGVMSGKKPGKSQSNRDYALFHGTLGDFGSSDAIDIVKHMCFW
jgi:hypothetical protein